MAPRPLALRPPQPYLICQWLPSGISRILWHPCWHNIPSWQAAANSHWKMITEHFSTSSQEELPPLPRTRQTETTIVSQHHGPSPLPCTSAPVAVVGSGTAQGGAGAVKSPWPWGLESCREKNLCPRGVGGGEPGQQAGKKPKAQCGQFRRRSWEHVKQHSHSCFKHFSGLNPAGHFHTS